VEFSWPERDQEAAFLIYDPNGNWKVDDGRELFGSTSPMSWGFSGEAAGDGFEALSFFDSPLNGGNGDGILDARDQVFQDLRLWFDRNHDGRSSDDELEWLGDRVSSISLDVHSSMKQDAHGNVFRYRSRVWFTDPMRGSRRFGFVWDVSLANTY